MGSAVVTAANGRGPPPPSPRPPPTKVYLLQEHQHPGLRGTPLAMLAAQCNKLSSMSPPPLADAAVGKGFHPWKKSSGGSPEAAPAPSRQQGGQSSANSNTASTFSTSPQQATSPAPAYGELPPRPPPRTGCRVMPKYLHRDSAGGIFPPQLRTAVTGARTRRITDSALRELSAALQRATIATFSVALSGSARLTTADVNQSAARFQSAPARPRTPPVGPGSALGFFPRPARHSAPATGSSPPWGVGTQPPSCRLKLTLSPLQAPPASTLSPPPPPRRSRASRPRPPS
jgi:hypothetical protein